MRVRQDSCVLLFGFLLLLQFAFLFRAMLSLLVLFPFPFVFFALITHIRFSYVEPTRTGMVRKTRPGKI